MERRYDIDWLRVIAIGFLILYHVVISFQPWGSTFGFLVGKNHLPELWGIMSLINVWRIPILFFISGMGVYFAMQKRNWLQLLLERGKRIFLPLIFSSFTVVALQNYAQQYYYQQSPITYAPSVAHLWFLVNILIYVLLLSPVFYHIKEKSTKPIINFLKQKLKLGYPLYLLAIPYVLEAIIVNPEMYTLYLFSAHGFFLGAVLFFLGFYLVSLGEQLFEMLKKLILVNLFLAIGLWVLRILFYNLESPNWLMAIESLAWMYFAFGLGYKYLNKPSKALNYLTKAVYPIYIIHFLIQNLICIVVFNNGFNVWLELFLVLIGTFTFSFICYELFIRRIPYWRVLFGLKKL